ncbi:hypothetical protein D3I60_04455 [Brevibacterium permense]|nr:hypothetical protein [Brevibacterium permense]
MEKWVRQLAYALTWSDAPFEPVLLTGSLTGLQGGGRNGPVDPRPEALEAVRPRRDGEGHALPDLPVEAR